MQRLVDVTPLWLRLALMNRNGQFVGVRTDQREKLTKDGAPILWLWLASVEAG